MAAKEIDNWNNSRLNWIEQYNKLGKLPSKYSDDPNIKTAAIWQQTMRRQYKNQLLSAERIKILEETEGWEWGRENHTWEESRLLWIEQYNKLGRLPSRYNTNDAYEIKSAEWYHHQIFEFNNNRIPADHIKILDETPGWKWREEASRINNWEENRINWIEQYKKLGRGPSETSNDSDEKRAARWQYDQRYNYKNATLSTERIQKLEETKGWYWEKSDNWEGKLYQWAILYKKLGKRPSNMSKNALEKRIGLWQNQQILHYKENKLSKEQIDKLEKTEGWKWEEYISTLVDVGFIRIK
jgi:hypothetical protein